MIEASASSPPASYPLTGKTCTAFMTSCTSSPSLRSRSSTDSVVSTEAICAGAETSNLTRDITSSVFIEVTLALIWFLAPYCGISFVAPFSLSRDFLFGPAVPRKESAQHDGTIERRYEKGPEPSKTQPMGRQRSLVLNGNAPLGRPTET